ncbi:MAG: radical SAM protein [Clostridiaceae bacterium]
MGIKDSVEKNAKTAVVKKVVKYLEKDPEKNVDKIFSLLKKTTNDEFSKERIDKVYQYYNEMPSVNEFIQDLLKNTNKNCMNKFVSNFIGNAGWYGIGKRKKVWDENGAKVPFTILISPSMRCNLRCTGCYAANYSRKDDIPIEEVDRIIGEARDLGIYYIVVLGGEPFFNEFMLDIYKKYDDVFFTPFSNGTLFDDKLADKLASLGNVMPMFSLEGWEKDTDARRGAGVFNKVMNSMDLLKARGVPFGVSSATSRFNVETVTSDAFIDMLIEKGAKMTWYFIFMPIGDTPMEDMDLMLSPEQRVYLGRRTKEIRTTKPYFTIDFFNDAPYVGGCIAGKYYCHINSHEDLEPCIFAHFATDNVKGKPLMDAFKAPYFKEIQKRQPYSDNLLRPCMMIDNPEQIREIVKETGAYGTHPKATLMTEDPEFMAALDKLAADFKPVADKAWESDFNKTGNTEMSKG